MSILDELLAQYPQNYNPFEVDLNNQIMQSDAALAEKTASEAMGKTIQVADSAIEKARDYNFVRGVIASLETQGEKDPNTAKSTRSTATGKYQFTKDTWASVVEIDPSLPPFEKMPYEDEAQDRGMDILLEANRRSFFRAFKREPEDEELLLAHRFGTGTSNAIVNAPPDTPLPALLSKKVLKANPDLERDYETIGEMRDGLMNKFSMAMMRAREHAQLKPPERPEQ